MTMQTQPSLWRPLWISTLCSALFIAVSSRSLPPLVASHFDAYGNVNGRMPNAVYVVLMLLIVIAAPLFVTILPIQSFRKSTTRINLPHRDYWLSPERQAATIFALSHYAIRFGIVLQVFLCYFHLVVVKANAGSTPSLVSDAFIAGAVAFFIIVLVWIVALLRRFQRIR